MSTSIHEMPISEARRKRAGRVAVAAFLMAWDVLLIPWAAASLLSVRLPVLDLGPEQYAPWLVSTPIAAVVCALAFGSLVSVWLCSEFRGFRWIMAISLAWVGFALFAQRQAELDAVVTLFFLARRVVVVPLLWSGRRAFAST